MRLDEAKNYTSGGALVNALQAESRERALGWLTDAATLLAAQTLLGELQAAVPTAMARLAALEEERARAAAALRDAAERAAAALTARTLAGASDRETYSAAIGDLQRAEYARDELAGALRAAEGRVSEAQRDLQLLQDHEAALGAVAYDGPDMILEMLKGR